MAATPATSTRTLSPVSGAGNKTGKPTRVALPKGRYLAGEKSDREGRGEQTRDQILEAARKALIREGYERITTRRIAKEAGVNIATLHYHFGTKEALLAEAARYGLRRIEQQLRHIIESAPSASEAVSRALQAVLVLVREHPGILRYDLAVRGFRDEVARHDAIAMYETYQSLTREIFTRHLSEGGTLPSGVSVDTLARYLVASVDGIVLQYTLNEDMEAARNCAALIEAHIRQMMGQGQTPAA